MTRLRVLISVLLCLSALQPSFAQDRNLKPLKIFVGSTPGGIPDVLARSFGQYVSRHGGQPVLVENLPGASGKLAADAVSRAPADGQTLLVCFYGPGGVAPAYEPPPVEKTGGEGFAPVGIFGYATAVIVTSTTNKWNSLQELGAHAKNDRLTYGSPGAATVARLYSELLGLSLGASFTHVAYKGMAPMLTDVAAGNISFAVSTVPPALPLIAAGRLRALAVTTGDTVPALAGVPTIAQAGIKEVDLNTWYGLWAREGTPPAAITRLNALLADYLKDAETARLLSNNGIVVATPLTSRQTAARLKADMAVWRSVVHRAGLKME